MDKYKQVLKNAAMFMLSKFIPKTIAFFLIPFYTTFLTTYEYGVSDFINISISLLMPILTLNIRDAVLRFSLDKKYDSKQIFSISQLIILFDFIVLAIFTTIELSFNLFNIPFAYLIFFDILILLNSVYDNYSSFCKAIEKVNVIVVASIVNSIITLLLNIFLIAGLKLGLLGFLLANTIGLLVSIFVYLFNGKIYKYFTYNIPKNVVKQMITYSFPMIFSSIAWWVNSASDKYLLTFFINVSVSGIYAAASKVPSILNTFENIFMQAWSISAIKDFDPKDSDGFIGNMYTLMVICSFTLCSFLIIFNIPISKILFNGEFSSAWLYVPPLLLSVAIDSISIFICNLFYAVKDTKSRAKVTIYAAIVNTLLNFILIHRFKSYGAAIATLLGYFVGYILSHVYLKRYITMKTNLLKHNSTIALLFVQVVFAFFGNKFLFFQGLILATIILLYIKEYKKICLIIKNKLKRRFKNG